MLGRYLARVVNLTIKGTTFWQLFIKCGLNISNVICGKDKTHRGPFETMLTFDNLRTTLVSKVSLIDEKN